MPLASHRPVGVCRSPFHLLLLGTVALSCSLAALGAREARAAAPPPVASRHRKKKTAHASTPSGGPRGRAARKSSASSSFFLAKPSHVVTSRRGRIAVFAFRNDDDGGLSQQVGHLLEARGLEVVSDVQPVDTAEQFRDVATHMDLAGYVEGDLRPTRDGKAKLTLRVRNGYTGRRVSQAVFTEPLDKLPRVLSDNLWRKLAPAISHACSDASRPRRHSKEMHINAGTPL